MIYGKEIFNLKVSKFVVKVFIFSRTVYPHSLCSDHIRVSRVCTVTIWLLSYLAWLILRELALVTDHVSIL